MKNITDSTATASVLVDTCNCPSQVFFSSSLFPLPSSLDNLPFTSIHHVCEEERYVIFCKQSDGTLISNTTCKIDGRQERVQFDKITARVSRLCYGLDTEHVDPVAITQKVISGVYGGVTTVQLDDLVSLLLCQNFNYIA